MSVAEYSIISILKDINNNTIGAKVSNGLSIQKVKTENLQIAYKKGVKFKNAILSENGFVRGRNGISLPIESAYTVGSKVKDCKIKLADNSFYVKEKEIALLHGSKNIIEKPTYGKGDHYNDYGQGFYCIPRDTKEKNLELAKEWACSEYNSTNRGFVNFYTLKMEGLNVLNLNMYNILVWSAITASHRNISCEEEIICKLKEQYYIEPKQYDCIYGWSCDDTYSNIIKEFLNDTLSDKAVNEAIRLGNLKNQFVLISQKAFSQLTFKGYLEVNPFVKYRDSFNKKKDFADEGLRKLKVEYRRQGKTISEYI
ncbi:MAG: DUF3990 domain-containing protein [Lachnospiraceae bacterium]|nr:DUF3990 domain-containing protein [Lachnospiraceae bacterium]